MKTSETNSNDIVPSLTTRPGCLGKVGSVLAFFIDFYRHLCKALESLPYEYESSRKFLGLPLLAINLGFDNPHGKMRHARGIIAIGNQATGIIAFGIFIARGVFTIALLAIGFVSVSIASVAACSVSVFGLGFVSVSVFAVGYLGVGILAIGYKCVGIVAIGQDVVGILAIGQRVRAVFSP
jgi:hypothetical protein